MERFRLSLQLYTIRSETKRDFLGACRRVAEMGYRWIEPAGWGDLKPEFLRREFDAMGLGVSGSHVGPEAVLNDADKIIEDHLALGCRDLTIAWVPESFRVSAEAWRGTASQFNRAAERFAHAGLRLGYHNHNFEFEKFDGRTGWRILFETAPQLQGQVDTFWVAKAGFDPAESIRFLKGRAPSVHVKDLGEDCKDIEFGLGVLDWPSIFYACSESGVEYLVAEMDNPRLPPLESAELCLKNLKKALADG